MIPQKLQLHNFMSYGQHLPPLDFRGVELACLTGDNGVGKSSLLEAMTWALWGKSRALSDDDLFRHGCRDMWVDFEFKLERSRYRVVRQRSLKKNKGQGSLEFMIGTKSPTGKSTKKRSADDWKSLTGTTKNETQDLINTTLRMNYETFVNSAFLRQGRADEFTIKKSQERKKVLANILNLDYYDRLADQAKANARQATIVAEGLQQQLTHLELEVKDKKALRAEAKNITSQLQVATKIVAKFQKQVTELDRDKEKYDQEVTQAKSLAEKISFYQDEVKALQVEYQEQQAILNEKKSFLTKAQKIERDYKVLLEYRQQVEEMNSLLARRGELLKEKTLLADKMAAVESKRELARGQRLGRLKNLQENVAQPGLLEKQRQKIAEQLALLDKRQAEQVTTKENIKKLEDKLAANKISLGQIVSQGQEIKTKIDSLQSTSQGSCPLCDQQLTISHQRKVSGQLEKAKVQKTAEYKSLYTKITTLQFKLTKQQADGVKLDQALLGRAKLESEFLQIESQIKTSQDTWLEIKSLEKKIAASEKSTQGSQQDEKDRQKLLAINEELATMGYDAKQHQAVRDQLTSLGNTEALKIKLDETRTSIKKHQLALQKLDKNKVAKEQLLQKTSQARQKLTIDVAKITKIGKQIERYNKELTKARAEVSQIQAQQGAAKEKLSRLQLLTKEIAKSRKNWRVVTRDKLMYEELAVAFGKKGIQAMIIENAIPEIEEEANRLLAKMTDDKMQVRFLTQKQKKTDKGIIETLDIIIEDEMGAKNYEMFSGGEAYRINFAIRIALSKLLANRAGARLQFLVIDEGFGTQDNLGRESLIEAINSVAANFAKIMVITHIQELKDAFPVRIEITKDDKGSKYEIIS